MSADRAKIEKIANKGTMQARGSKAGAHSVAYAKGETASEMPPKRAAASSPCGSMPTGLVRDEPGRLVRMRLPLSAASGFAKSRF